MASITTKMPDHTQLPDSDGAIVENFQELPQTIMISEGIDPILKKIHPDGKYLIGQNSGIYWKHTDSPLDGCKAPDWFYVPGVPKMLDGQFRRSYVLWQEKVPPFVILEFASGDGSEERDQTPEQGKFWVYERMIRPTYYAIYEAFQGTLEVHHLENDRFVRMEPNLRGHFEIPELGVELGLWTGTFRGFPWTWLRWFDKDGQPLLADIEKAEVYQAQAQAEQRRAEAEAKHAQAERDRAETEAKRAQAERDRAEAEAKRAAAAQERVEKLTAKLRELGTDPDTL